MSLAWGDAGYGDDFFWGLCTTLLISICGYAVAMVIGLLGAWAKLCHVKALNRAGDTYTTVVRSLPELLFILLIFYAGTPALTRLLVAMNLVDEGFEINPTGTVIFA